MREKSSAAKPASRKRPRLNYMKHTKKKQLNRKQRAHRTRLRIRGTQIRPRLSVKRSSKHIYAQLINDVAGVTLVSASDRDTVKQERPKEKARAVGKALAEKAKAVGIQTVVFDRGPYRYHGRVAALADGAREEGLIF